MKPLTPKQVKIAWIVAGVLALIHFAPIIITSVRGQFVHVNSAPAPARPQPPRPLPVIPLPVVPVATVTPPAPTLSSPDAQTAKFLGIWTGSTLMPNMDSCQAKLELRMSQDKLGTIMGYETRNCIPTLLMGRARVDKDTIPTIIERASPVSALLTGTVIDGDIAFRVDNTVGTLPNHCSLTSYAVSPSGQDQLVAQWQEGTCKPGNMVLKRTQR